MFQYNDTYWDFNIFGDNAFAPVVELMILLFLMFIQLWMYRKKKVFIFITLFGLAGLIFGAISIANHVLPFSPWLQVMFILFNFVMIVMTAIESYNK